jgi:hypothetical protein
VALTLAGVGNPPITGTPGSRVHETFTVTFDASYPTGGYAITAANLGLSTLDTIIPNGVDTSGTYLVSWNQATGKLQLFSALATEVTNATDVHTKSVTVAALGYR